MSSRGKGKAVPAKKGKAPAKAPAKAAGSTSKPPDEKPKQPPILDGIECPLKEIANLLLQDQKGEIKKSGRWPVLIDSAGAATTFLRYRDVNYLCTANSSDMKSETIRRALIGSIRFGKPFVIDVLDTDMIDFIRKSLDDIQPNLARDLFNKDLLANENYLKLVRDEDGELYDHNHQFEFRPDDFMFIIATSRDPTPENLLQAFLPVRMK